MPEHSHNEDGSLTAEGELFGYICSATGRAYDLTEYVNDTNREHTEVFTAFNINTGFDMESYPYGRMELGGEGHTDFYGCRAESYHNEDAEVIMEGYNINIVG